MQYHFDGSNVAINNNTFKLEQVSGILQATYLFIY